MDLPLPSARGLLALGRRPLARGRGLTGPAVALTRGRQGARGGRGPAPRPQGPRRPCVGYRRPESPFRCARLEQRAPRGRGRRTWRRPGGRRLDPPGPGVERNPRQVPGLCPLRAPAGVGWGARLVLVSRPPRRAAASPELCRRLAPARSSCSSFPGNFRPGIAPPGCRAGPPAQPAAQAPP